MQIAPFASRGAFNPEAVQALAAVLRDACRELGLKRASDPAAEVVAEMIIRLASTGDYDERGLQVAVLTALGRPRGFASAPSGARHSKDRTMSYLAHCLDAFVAEANIESLGKLLVTETDEAKRQTMLRLLAEERAKLAALLHPGE
jgi:hypothetical protein